MRYDAEQTAALCWLALLLRPHAERRILLAAPLAGLAVAGLAIVFAAGTGKGSSEVLFSGQSAVGPLISKCAGYTVGALLLLLACKGIAYVASARLTPDTPPAARPGPRRHAKRHGAPREAGPRLPQPTAATPAPRRRRRHALRIGGFPPPRREDFLAGPSPVCP
jgi:hypothetical protein